MTTEQNVLDDLIQAIDDTNRSNDDFLKVLKEGRDQDVVLRDGTVVPSLTKRAVNAFSNSDYLMKADNLASVIDKQEARANLEVYSKIEVDDAISSASSPETPNATETVAGKAKIATTAIAQAGANDTDIITAKKLRDALNATGNAPVYACRAWVNFNGEGVVSVIASGNVSSVTDNGVGDYTLNFATSMPNANYSISISSTEYSDASPILVSLRMSGTTPLLKTTAAVRVSTRSSFNSTLRDINSISVQVFC